MQAYRPMVLGGGGGGIVRECGGFEWRQGAALIDCASHRLLLRGSVELPSAQPSCQRDTQKRGKQDDDAALARTERLHGNDRKQSVARGG